MAGSFNISLNNLLNNQMFKNKNVITSGNKKIPTKKNENSNRSKRNRERVRRIRKKKEENKKVKMEKRLKKEKLYKLAKGI